VLESNSLVVVGGGHAGVEAALAASRLGVFSYLVTLDVSAIGRLSCNPAVGGLAKSHLVKEIDALGGVMGFASDKNALQYKTLNKTKGRAVWSTRVQLLKKKYPLFIVFCINKGYFFLSN
jgi:tRNA uridine 5-carboxymethylaminomethyl modification enzyme